MIFSISVISFAVLFFVVGLFRIVEFQNLDFSKLQKTIFITTHVLGCLAFSTSAALTVLDPHQHYRSWEHALFFSAVILLFPVQIFVGIKRRVKLQAQMDEKMRAEQS